MERIQIGGRRVVGFGVGGPINDAIGWWNKAFRSNVYDPNVGTTPVDAPTGPTVQDACASIPASLQAIAGCTNANVKPPPGTSVPTAPALLSTLPFGGGIDANGKPIQSPYEWFQEHKTAIAVGAAVTATVVVGGVLLIVTRR